MRIDTILLDRIKEHTLVLGEESTLDAAPAPAAIWYWQIPPTRLATGGIPPLHRLDVLGARAFWISAFRERHLLAYMQVFETDTLNAR